MLTKLKLNSFPSGHTANAFCGAELMRIEYGNWVGLAGYAVAVTTGVMRMYNERHWWNAERHHKLIPLNEQAIEKGASLI